MAKGVTPIGSMAVWMVPLTRITRIQLNGSSSKADTRRIGHVYVAFKECVEGVK